MKKHREYKDPSGLERVTLTISIFVVVVGAIVYGWIDEPSSKTVMIIVFIINALTIGAVLLKIFMRRKQIREERRNEAK